uniref:ABC transporter domain-containing protein n=1 Tax=Clastoptera arizonana TaxID=38151 RepID=A0A1B6CU20_9HEMI
MIQVGLRDAVAILPFGLDTESRHWDKTFTADQRQLLYLALAVTSKNNIIIVDLASRNTQPESERSLLNLVQEIFPLCTVVIMSERLRLVMAAERVLVLESGRMAEYGHPYLLLQNKYSHLNKMIQEAGPSALKAQLLNIAKNSYINGKRPPIKEDSMESVECINYI